MTGLGRGYSAQSNLPALQKRLQELQLQYTDSYPEIIRLKDEMRGMEAQMKNAKPTVVRPSESPEYDRLNSELRAIRQAEANLRTNIARNRSLLQNIPAAKAQLDNLEREKQSQKTLYESMLGRQGQSEVSKQMEVQDKSTVFRVVDPAVLPIKPVSPDRKKLILLGILAGIGGGLGLVILKDQMDNTIKSVDMARLIGLPLLAVIPHIDDPEQLAQQTRQDRKLYAAGVLYFLVILTVLVMEVFGFAIISDLMREIIGLIR
jgi:polysaccharide chain length determinant protein (PEP-CTERM system associated)